MAFLLFGISTIDYNPSTFYMGEYIFPTGITQETSPVGFSPISHDASHSVVGFEMYSGVMIVKKIINHDFLLPPGGIKPLYLAYHRQVSGTYPRIPEIYKVKETGKHIELLEEAVSGENMESIIFRGDKEKWLRATRSLFIPLVGAVESNSRLVGPFLSKYPLKTPVDIKPANVIIQEDGEDVTAIPIDFFPPLLALSGGTRYVHTHTELETFRIRYSFADLEVLMARHLFETIKINSVMAKEVTREFLEFCDEIDSSGDLRQRLNKNVILSKHRCPRCPYCFNS